MLLVLRKSLEEAILVRIHNRLLMEKLQYQICTISENFVEKHTGWSEMCQIFYMQWLIFTFLVSGFTALMLFRLFQARALQGRANFKTHEKNTNNLQAELGRFQ